MILLNAIFIAILLFIQRFSIARLASVDFDTYGHLCYAKTLKSQKKGEVIVTADAVFLILLNSTCMVKDPFQMLAKIRISQSAKVLVMQSLGALN